MSKTMFLYLCAAMLLTATVAGLAFAFARVSIQTMHAKAVGGAQGNGITWNSTDCNATVAEKTYLGPQILPARITVEYGDLVVQKNLTSGFPNLPILSRIVTEYADAVFQFYTQPLSLNQTLPPRVMVEYADYASMALSLQQYSGPMPFPHDVAVTNVSSLGKTVVGQNYTCSMNVNVSNECDFNETFCVEVYANSTMMVAQTVYDLLNGTFTMATFTWDTTGFAYGNYTLWGLAPQVPGETNTADNNCTCIIPVHVGVPGDISGRTQGVYDGTCNMRDIQYLILLFTTKPSSPNWNPNADINNDGTVNMRDINIAILNFTKHE